MSTTEPTKRTEDPTMSTMRTKIRKFTDDKLAREIVFADGFGFTDPDGRAWYDALLDEALRRAAIKEG